LKALKKTLEMAHYADFYDGQKDYYLQAYLQANPRATRAIGFAIQNCNFSPSNILDLGVGLGWSTHELAKAFPQAMVLGVEQSEKLLDTGKQLFQLPNLHYLHSDLMDVSLDDQKFSAVVLLDVFEHIPLVERDEFYRKLNALLNKNFKVVLTCPSASYQQYLHANAPGDLQPVDEIVSKNDLEDFAEKIGGKLTFYEEISIWREKDYFHALISKGSFDRKSVKFRLESIWSRRRRALKMLNYRLPLITTIKTYLRCLLKI
jgi:2-polyprenyl-3-methyl-5-hydroxy-6-metoxy-1,4-benzoquinol methylase